MQILQSELTKGSSFSCLFFSRIVQFSRCSFRRSFEVLFSSGDLFIIPHFRIFVKPFFKVFWSFFLDRGSGSFPVSLDQVVSLFIIPHFKLFVKRFFRFFQIFFLSRSTRICDFSCPLPRSATPVRLGSELFYYTTFHELCQEVFRNFFSLSSLVPYSRNCTRLFIFSQDTALFRLPSSRSLVRQLYYYNTHFPKCQAEESPRSRSKYV